ncbi:hypothetical protein [Halobacterium yunchengense]|uniref:hypothetical protein n=1 Tax=Halobacterium yunchengense TaxID=3108497 RepID=UPI00300A1B53
MTLWFDVLRAGTALNLALAASLSVVWLRNYRRYRSAYLLGFLAFGGFLLAQNAYALYLFALDPATSGWFAEIPPRYTFALAVLAVCELAALLALTWVTRQ